jgi:hypothetical protein
MAAACLKMAAAAMVVIPYSGMLRIPKQANPAPLNSEFPAWPPTVVPNIPTMNCHASNFRREQN